MATTSKIIAEHDHWRLLAINQQRRAEDAEEKLLQLQYQQLQLQKSNTQAQWTTALAEVGKAVGAKGNLQDWTITFGDTPKNSMLTWKDNNGRD